MNLVKVQQTVSDLVDDSTAEYAANAWIKLAELKRLVKEIDAEARNRLAQWIKNHGEIEIGDGKKLILKHKSTQRSGPVDEILTQVIERTRGDVQSISKVLSTNAFKPTATKKLIDDAEDKYFWKDIKDDVELAEFDEKFLERK